MKCVIFAGGKGSRISVYGDDTPKPLITIGGKPIIWHIIKIYEHYGIKDFILCLGYKQEKFKEYFSNLIFQENDLSISFRTKEVNILNNKLSDLNILLIDTGENTSTGGRLKRIEKYIGDDDTFLLTYGDAVSDVNINDLIKYHDSHNKLITITSVLRKENFGIIKLDNSNSVVKFQEKSEGDSKRINAGFMVVNRKVFDYLNEDSGAFEKEVLEPLANSKEVEAYLYDGFWQCMDYRYERQYLEDLIHSNNAKWIY